MTIGAEFWDRPCAAKGLNSYRYPSPYGGYIMIGANDLADAVAEANRSLSRGFADSRKMEVWSSSADRYVAS